MEIKRVYDPPATSDGMRVLVDRIWPRGLSKQAAALDHWLKDLAPSTALRKWFDHRPERWDKFRDLYRDELAANPSIKDFRRLMKGKRVTLLYAAHDTEHNQAVVLADYLQRTQRHSKPKR